jgi:pimeloyl-ACP methyl ester carboxylesterase
MAEHEGSPFKKDGKIAEHPISSFNLNAHGENPDFELAGVEAPDLTPTPELKAELADRKTVTDPETEQAFGYVELNRDAEPSNTLVCFLAYSIDTEHEGTKYELEQIALQSGQRLVAFENPSTGLSDKLTTEQKDALKEGDWSVVAKGMLGAMKAQGLTEVDLEGSSMGARTAMAVAAHAAEFGIKVKNLVLIEPPGLTERSWGGLVRRFLVNEGMVNAPQYVKTVHDERGLESLDSPIDALKNFVKLLKTDVRGNAVAYPKGLGQETALEDLIQALETQPDMKMTMLSGGASEIAPRDDVNETYQVLDENYPGRAGLVLLPGDTHALGIGAARRIGWHVSRLLK